MKSCPAGSIFADPAGIAQLVERNSPKVEVAGSNPVSRSQTRPGPHGRGAYIYARA